ncbi:MAG: hypothetical protein Q8930_07840 [Bacillota bacterium]|nr:hypothetical protein [Bacillota bacterium]
MVNEFQPCTPEDILDDTGGKGVYIYRCPACGSSRRVYEGAEYFQCSCGYSCGLFPVRLKIESIYEKNRESGSYNVFELPEKGSFELDYCSRY